MGKSSSKARRLPRLEDEHGSGAEEGEVRQGLEVCPLQLSGQLVLFASPPRTLLLSHASHLQGRELPGRSELFDVLDAMAAERGVGDRWRALVRSLGLLALAAREPGEDLVRPETLTDLPQMAPTIAEALARAGLLDRRRPRLVPQSHHTRGSCEHCLAWANDRWKVCIPCTDWRIKHPDPAPCSRCRRVLPLSKSLCRFCTLVLAETEVDLHQAALVGGDQLWFGGPFTPTMRTDYGPDGSAPSKGRYAALRRQAKAAARAARPLSPHLAAPGQQALFDGPARDWSRLDEAELPAMTAAAAAVLDDFGRHHLPDRGWQREQVGSSIRVLRILMAYLGADVPIREADIRSLASLGSNHQCARVIDYLRRRDLLDEDESVNADLAGARAVADGLPDAFARAVNTWIDVLVGQATKPSLPVAPATARRYVRDAVAVLKQWDADGLTDLRAITKTHVEDAITDDTDPVERRARHVALRSLFRALRRERLIFRDPARGIRLHVSPRLPAPLPSDRLRGLLDKVPETRGRLILALVAIHALTPANLRRLQLRGLDRASGQLRVIRPGRSDHIVFLDELTLGLATDWVIERSRLWPRTTNPHLLISRVTAASDGNPEITKYPLQATFRRVGISASALRQDRILDEAHATADPVHLMRLFGLAETTAVNYVATAHPADIRPDPIAP
ncbi:hypothetical protein LIX60_14290 [Streptomyces sp. S07_1.15]|uniref:site-specific integrase n=1 Tax=Streptomyces sp. S07_1.15 TaxID=2873925 RepID=UPI001D15CA9A|nr:hypothetical protein [Streptomyces sp. S07_1.15]MCC3652614.1 hypothetical protein [Streptomyces sp. S07_1.15]